MKKIYKYLFFLLVIFLSGFLLSGCTTSEEKISQYNQMISEADLLIDSKEYTLAVEKLSKASELIPTKMGAVERIVDIFILKNRLDDASRIVDDSGTKLKEGERSILYSKIGKAFYNLKEYDKAVYNYQLGMEMGDTNSDASLGIAKVKIQKGDIQEAKSFLQKNLDGERNIEGKLLLSYIEALSDIEKAYEAIKNVEPSDNWQDTYSRWNEVLDDLTQEDLFNSAKLARQYIFEGYPSLAITLLEPRKEEMSEYPDGIYLLGKAYYEQKEYEKSISLLEDTTSISDLNPYIYWVLARSYYLLDNLEESFSYYDSAIAYFANDSDMQLYIEYIDILSENNRLEKALEVIKKAEKIFNEAWIQLSYMKIYSLREDSEKFEYHMERVDYEELGSELKAVYLFSKGSYLIQNSKIDDVRSVLDVFSELNEYDPRYKLLSAQLSFQEGNMEDTKIYCKKAIEYDLASLVTDEAQKLLAQVD
jgi:tetratricopeptide (TPR) repeat protein